MAIKRLISYFLLLAIFLFAFQLSAQQKAIGPDISELDGKALKWENGARDYFVMHKTLLKHVTGAADTQASNPQADTCADQEAGSTYELVEKYIPDDAYVEAAYLIWIAAIDPANLLQPADNSVTLEFKQASDYSLKQTITAPLSGTIDASQGFSFEGFSMAGATADDPTTGIFTYRVDVSDFFKQIQENSQSAGIASGLSLLGKYTVTGMDCTQDQAYIKTSSMVGGWALAIIYNSSSIKPKNIYMYNGLKAYRNSSGEIAVQGFKLPADAEVSVTLFVAEGDPGLFSAVDSNMEGLFIHGQNNPQFTPLFNNCNPNKGNYIEVYNSISSVYGWQETKPECIGDINDLNSLEFAMDVDTFKFNSKYSPFDEQFKTGDTSLTLKVSANQDQIYSNLLIISIDTEAPKYDIPETASKGVMIKGREKNFCSCSSVADTICIDRPYYYIIKVQNWGDSASENVTIKDTLFSKIHYVEGSTEIATKFDSAGDGINWSAIEDGEGGEFPFAEPYQVAAKMEPCDKKSGTCKETVMVRFKVMPDPVLNSDWCVVPNSALISDSSGIGYNTNTRVPLNLLPDRCVPLDECPEPDKKICGGDRTDGVDDASDKDVIVSETDSIDRDTIAPSNDDDFTETKKSGSGCSINILGA